MFRTSFWVAAGIASVLALAGGPFVYAGGRPENSTLATPANVYGSRGVPILQGSDAGELVITGTITGDVNAFVTGNVNSAITGYPAMARVTSGCLSATWTVDVDGGAQGLLLAADGGFPVSGTIYACTATKEGCYGQGSQPHTCAFQARFQEGGSSFEAFVKAPNDAGTAVPRVYGIGLTETTTFDCCPYVAQ